MSKRFGRNQRRQLKARLAVAEEARPWLDRLRMAHPKRSFRVMTINPLSSEVE